MPLADADRRWLVQRCKGWAAQLEKHLTDLEAGGDIGKVRDEADATARQIARVLRTRAESV